MGDEKFMEEAIIEAQQAFEQEEVPIGAVCVLDDMVIGRGHNRVETLKDPTAHAEMLAITAAANQIGDWRLDGVTIYVTVQPCLMCFGAIIRSRIKRLVYGCAEPKFGFPDHIIKHNIEIKRGILANKSQRLLTEFFKLRRNE